MVSSEFFNRDVEDFFRHQEPTIPYQSARSFAELHTSDPWTTYRNFKCETHLPWLPLDLFKLSFPFPWQQILKEAKGVEHLAAPHRDGEHSRGWKSLCLHGLGSTKTLAADSYGYSGDAQAPYTWTEIAEACPVASLYFQNVFPHSRYNRLRFMYLEPGGFIAPHEDVIDPQPHFTAINIALNQPAGCQFLMGTPEFKALDRWGTVPFKQGGDCFWLDLRNHHAVVNTSTETRIHIIVHFAIDRSDALSLEKFCQLLPRTPQLPETKTQSKRPRLKVSVGLLQPKGRSQDETTCLAKYSQLTHQMTRAMCSPVDLEKIVVSEDMSGLLQQAQGLDSDFFWLLGPGQVVRDEHLFWRVMTKEIEQSPQCGLWGHLMDRGPGRSLGLHPQMILINLRQYRTLASGLFGEAARQEFQLTNWIRSDENIHDDYTPLWVRPAQGSLKVKESQAGWKLLDDFLANGVEVKNFPSEAREGKIHGYPEDNFSELVKYLGQGLVDWTSSKKTSLFEGQSKFLDWLKQFVDGRDRMVWIYNNERLPIVPEKLQPGSLKFYAGPASGSMDFLFYANFGDKNDFTGIHFDISGLAIDFKKSLLENFSGVPFQVFLQLWCSQRNPAPILCELKPKQGNQSLDEIGCSDAWVSYQQKPHSFLSLDVTEEYQALFHHIPRKGVGVLNLSNIFCYIPNLWLKTAEELNLRLKQLILMAKAHNPDIIIVGKDSYGASLLETHSGPRP